MESQGELQEEKRRTKKKKNKNELENSDDEETKTKDKKRSKIGKKRAKKKEPEENDLNNQRDKTKGYVSKSDTENEDRIQNDISDNPAKEKNTNIQKDRKKKKNERRGKEDSNFEKKSSIEDLATTEAKSDPNVNKPENKNVIGVFVHESEVLEMDFLVCHPVVKVSIVDGATGQLINKTDPGRRVTSFYENESVSKILPLMTQPYDFKEKRSIVPKWEELLLFNDNFEQVFEKDKNKNIVLFFEIIDFLPMSVANKNFRRYGQKGGWYRIAWAFLKLVDEDWRSMRFGQRTRLQMYKPSLKVTDGEGTIKDVWTWWRSDRKNKYPSTLWVTVEPVAPPTSSEPALRSMLATQPEHGQQVGFSDMKTTADESQPLVVWSRLPGQSCKVPSLKALELESGPRGCSALAFSSDGRKLAVASSNQTTSVIRIYDFPSGIFLVSLAELYGLVYELSFHKDGVLLAAVGDGSALIWSSNTWELQDKLSHPSYVYSSQFHPISSRMVATGGFDRVVRIWKKECEKYSVVQELSGHNNHINCITFDIEGHFLFSGDNKGVIKMWESPENFNQLGFDSSTDSFARYNSKPWSLKKEYVTDGPDSGAVCKLGPHPGGRRLLVHTIHPSTPLKMLDLRTGSVMQAYPDIQNFRLPAASCITPCGSWVLGGSDCGVAILWNTDTGEKKHLFKELMYDKPVSAVAFHPLDHAMAVGSIEANSKIGVYIYDKKTHDIEDKEGALLPTPRESQPLYPRGQVAKLIHDTAEPDTDRDDARTPVDLQDIVEKLNNAIKDCRMKNNLNFDESSPKHGQ